MRKEGAARKVSKGDETGIARGSWGHWGVWGALWGQSSGGHRRLGGLKGFFWHRAMS